MLEIVTVEVAGKFGLKIDGAWYGVSKPLKASDFENGSSYEVEKEEWKPGRFNIVKAKVVDAKASPATKAVAKKQQKVVKDDGDAKSKRILVQGLVQASLHSPSLAALPLTTVDEIASATQELADKMIEYVENKS